MRQGAIGAATGALSGAVKHRITTGSWKGAGQAALDGAADGFMTGTITGAIQGGINSPYCFVAGTLVQTADGTAAIETIEVGDYVWAWDELRNDVSLKRVLETYVNETDELVHVFVNGEEIVTTPSHPFYSPVKGWTDAVHLRKVYNFQVEDYHTYYVRESGVLVHNSCGDTGTYNKLRAANKGSGNEVHHIIEKRFLKGNPSLGSPGKMSSVVLSKADRRVFTNLWRENLPYGKTYGIAEIADAARKVYAGHKQLLDIALDFPG